MTKNFPLFLKLSMFLKFEIFIMLFPATLLCAPASINDGIVKNNE